MPVPSFDPRPQHEPLLGEIKAAFARVLESGKFIGGEYVEGFERDFARAVGTPHAVAISSGTDALLVALMALDVGAGDVVVTTPFTFFATAGVIRRLGAEPLFCDIDPATMNLSPARVEERLAELRRRRPSARARVLLPVHLFGLAVEIDPLQELAKRHDLAIVEDAAQAFGARTRSGNVGALGALGCFSFYPTKNLGGLGDGGAVTTRDAALDKKLRMLRNHGQGEQYEHQLVGGNFRLDALQCVALQIKLKHVEEWNRERVALARRYADGVRAQGLAEQVRLPEFGAAGAHVFHQFVIRVARRDELKKFLAAKGIGSAVYYPIPLHLQPCFRSLGVKAGEMPESERAAREVLALPMYPGLAPSAVDEVVGALAAFFRG